jgi:nucleoside-diphosphate-sugar epimerase
MTSFLVIGAGYLGGWICRLASEAGHQVFAARRSPPSQAELDGAPLVHWHAMDVLDPLSVREAMATINGVADVGTVIYCVSAGAGSVDAYHDAYRHGVRNVLAALNPSQRFIFVSSTGVYPEDEGQWVDEFHEIDAEQVAPAQRAIIEGEAMVMERRGSVVARLSGIYGPGRERMLMVARNAVDPIVVEQIAWTNRVHVEDGARALIHIATMESPGRLYCVTDYDPAAQHEITAWLRQQMGMSRARIVYMKDGNPVDNAAGLPESNKRVRNNLLVSTGFVFKFQTYREGYAPLCQKP